MKALKFKQIVHFSPAFDKRHANPNKDYGIGSVQIRFVLQGKRGAVQLLLGTDWYLPESIKEYEEKGNRNLPPPINLRDDKDFLKGWDLGYHSPKPMFKGHELMEGKCEYV